MYDQGDAHADRGLGHDQTAGRKTDIRLELRENSGAAEARLMWSSLSQPKQIIPEGQLNVPPQPAALSALDYSYDAVGNRLSESGTDLGGNAVGHSYTYDSLTTQDGDRLRGGNIAYDYDQNGNMPACRRPDRRPAPTSTTRATSCAGLERLESEVGATTTTSTGCAPRARPRGRAPLRLRRD